ncbi:uncharacterized protein LOC117177237 isoform X3 [Belonocnema kinseyi]|uniref:uncharacterized protein LOC117177237 isoform X3 n=1 Tax=Belonocnema kinseyi TaxID=2817044 RepID=UPI00143D21F0|nr:uncharacterized protein LOC117177237 isoform X3 [Belonocnema kinseyi]XP_033223706.1 uncharacterized protein LOC117177237 isoform X3 [Belonocnema kinseyi]XP_033223707.1 uncharacterized protein LOC117177237 isoform X3 [Belonocnema kinseyi]
MGLREEPEQMYYATLTKEEKARMHPCRKAKCVMMSGDSPPPLQSSIPPGFDMPDEMRHGKITPTETPLIPMKPRKNNGEIPNEDIEEAVPIVKTLPMPEPQPKVERNGGFDYDHTDGKQLVNDVEDDACFVKCIYFTQQCCECTVL